MSFYNQGNSYPGAPQASTYPGAPSFPTPSPYGGSVGGGPSQSASTYYDTHPIAPSGGSVHYDERGNPLPQSADGERGIGTMALGAIGGVAANKMSGGHQSTFKSGASGAMLAQGAKMAYEMFNKKKNHGHNGHHGHHGHGPPGGHGQGLGDSFGGLFGKH